jgi:AraC-like DNA-binding protein
VSNNHVRQMLDVINTHYADAITLQTLSVRIGRQPAYLGRLFREEVGVSLRQYLTRVRLEHAAALVREGVKIEAIALSVGYRSKKNFYLQFRKRYGMTPLPYRWGLNGPKRRKTETALVPFVGIVPPPPEWPPPQFHPDNSRQHGALEREPDMDALRTIVRAANRAWRLATRAQHLILEEFNSLRIGMLLTDGAGRNVRANRAAMALTGYSRTELHELVAAELLVNPPARDWSCAWLILLPRCSDGCLPNALLRTKTGTAVAIHLIALRNPLCERREVGALLHELRWLPA